MINKERAKSLQIDFTDEAWDKLDDLKKVILRMMGSRVELLRKTPHLIGLLEWFWNNRNEFEAWTAVDGVKKKFIF